MFQCKDLLSLTTMSEAKVIAGMGGMDRDIRWSYKAENINFENWVHGKELLIISSPVTQRKNYNLYKIIEKAIRLQMSCALLLIGDNYVSSVDEDVLELAERNSFPLFTIPWNVPLLDFFEELGHAISYLDDRKDIQDSFLAEIIFGDSINTNSIAHKCEQMGYDKSVLEQIFIMHLDGVSKDVVRSYAGILNGIFQKNHHPAIVSCYGNRIVGFMKDCMQNRQTILDIFSEFGRILENEQAELTYSLNIGEQCKAIEDLQKNYHETSKVNSILKHIKRQNEVVFYDQMGYYRFLMSYENKEPMRRFVQEILGDILQYDEKNNTQLIDTLWAYFRNDCNLQRAADSLFTHKNTVKYRLQRIAQITSRDMNNRFQSLELYNALIIYYYESPGQQP